MAPHLRSFGARCAVSALLFALVTTGLAEVTATPAQAADPDPILITSGADAGPGSLRQALVDANAEAGPSSIAVDSPTALTITVDTTLPEIVAPVDLDLTGATLEPSGPVEFGLVFGPESGGSTLAGAFLRSFETAQVRLDGPDTVSIEQLAGEVDEAFQGAVGAALIESVGATAALTEPAAGAGVGPLVRTLEAPVDGFVRVIDGQWSGNGDGTSLGHNNHAIDSRDGRIEMVGGSVVLGTVLQRAGAGTPELLIDGVTLQSPPGVAAIDVSDGLLSVSGTDVFGAPPLRVDRSAFTTGGIELFAPGIGASTYEATDGIPDVVRYAPTSVEGEVDLEATSPPIGLEVAVEATGLRPDQTATAVVGIAGGTGCAPKFSEQAAADLVIDGSGGGVVTFSQSDLPAVEAGDRLRAYVLTATQAGDPGLRMPVFSDCDVVPEPPVSTTPPVIFLPGFLGSEIVCTPGGEKLWPRADVPAADMGLAADGQTTTSERCTAVGPIDPDYGPGHTTADNSSGVAECLPLGVACPDIYRAPLRRIAALVGADHLYPFGWDWRKDTSTEIARLDGVIDQALADTGAQQVQIVAHSYGGLLALEYAQDLARRNKLARVTTVGTPYLGSPKPVFTLLTGTEFPGDDWGPDLETFFDGPQDLQRMSRNLRGLYNLWPSASYGDFLTVNGQLLDDDGTAGVVGDAAGSPDQWRAAQADHVEHWDRLDVGDLPWRIVTSGGIGTVNSVEFTVDPTFDFRADEEVSIRLDAGDETVPLRSQRMGTPDGGTIPGDATDARILELCASKHMNQMSDPALYTLIEGWITDGTEPTTQAPCTRAARSVVVEAIGATFVAPLPDTATDPGVDPGEGPVDVLDAEAAGLVDVVRTGAKAFVVIDPDEPIDLLFEPVDGETMELSFVESTADENTEIAAPVSASRARTVSSGGGEITVSAPTPAERPADYAAEELNARMPDLVAALPDLFGAFDLGADQAVITDQLAALYDLADPDTLAALDLPTAPGGDPVDTTLDAVADLIEDAGCEIDFIRDGAGGRSAAPGEDDVLQARCERSLADLAPAAGVSPFESETPGFLEDLGGSVGLDVDESWDADLTATLVFGVDLPGEGPGASGGGFYLLGESGARLDVGGEVSVTAPGGRELTPSGTVGGSLAVAAGPDVPDATRLRLDALDTPWTAEVTGETSADLALAFPGGSLRWQGSWDLGPGGVTTGPQTLTGTVELPGATAAGGGPISLVLTGTLVPAGWEITGELSEPAGATFDGFEITALDAAFLATGSSFTGKATVGLRIPVGDQRIDIDAVVELGVDEATIEATASSAEITFFDSVTITDALLTVSGRAGSGTASLEATLTGTSLTALDGSLVIEDFAVAVGTDGRFTVNAAATTIALGDGTILIEVGAVALSFGPEATGPLFTVASAVGTIPELANLQVEVTDLVVRRNGAFDVQRIVATVTDVPTIDLAGVLRIDLDSVEVRIDPDTFDVDISAIGAFDLPALDGLPFEPVIRVGEHEVDPEDPATNRFAFDARISDGELIPMNLGPISIGWADLPVGDYLLDGEAVFGGIRDEARVDEVSGRFGISGPGFGDGLEIEIEGAAGSDELDLTGRFTLPTLDLPGGMSVSELTLTAGVTWRRTGAGVEFEPRLEGIEIGEFAVPFGAFATATASNVELHFLPAPGDPFATFGEDGLGVTFDDVPVLAGWGGTVSHFAIGADFRPYALAGFGVDVDIPNPEALGLPEWLPLQVDEAGMRFPDISEEIGGPEDPVQGGFEIGSLDGFAIRISGGVSVVPEGAGEFGMEAAVRGLEIDFARLVAGQFPITNLEGISAGVPEFDFAGVRIGGELAIGTLQVDDERVFYLRIAGTFAMGDIGAGLDLVVTEYGPLVAEVSAPLGIPIDPTGLLLASVSGGISFGNSTLPDPDPENPIELLSMPAFEDLGDVDVTTAGLEALVRPAVEAGVPTWETGATLYVAGHLTHAAMPIVSGDVTLGAAFGADGGLDVLMKGDIEVFGMALGEGGYRIDLSRPFEPAWQFAFAAPPPASPIAFLMPARAELSGVLNTDGLVEGSLLGVRAFLTAVADGTIEAGGIALQGVVDRTAAGLEADRRTAPRPDLRPLTRAVLDVDGNGSLSEAEAATAITSASLLTRARTLLTPGTGGIDVDEAAAVMQDLLAELSAATSSPDAATSAAEAQEALLAAIAQGVLDAGRAFLDVADPKLSLEGSFQPQILGVPLGSPTDEVDLFIDKAGLTLQVSTSFAAWINRLSSLAVGPLSTLTGLGLPSDQVTVIAALPTGDLVEALLEGAESPAAEAASSSWGVTIEGELGYFGLKFVELSGMLVPAANADFVDDHTQQLFDGEDFDPTDRDRPVPLLQPEHRTNLIEVGGLVLTGALQAPRLITDPVSLYSELDLEPPKDITDLPAWLEEIGGQLTKIESPGLVQMYLPPPAEAGRAHLVGRWDARLLSVPLGDGEFALDDGGLDLTGQIPMLGLDGRFRILPADEKGSGLPRVSLDAGVSPALLRESLLDIGVPASAIPAVADLPSGRLRLFSPGFDPTATLPGGAPDRLQRQGGLQMEARLTVPGVGTRATFRLDVGLGTDGTPSSVTGAASLTGGTIGPLTLNSFDAALSIDSTGLRASIDGSGTVFGNTVTVRGSLDGNGRGSLTLTLDSDGADLAGFALTGSLTLVSDAAGVRIDVNGRLALPAWLSAASGQASVSVSGRFEADGNTSLTLSVTRLTFAGLQVNGTFRFVRAAGVVTVSLTSGSIRIPGTDRNVNVSGSFSSTGFGDLSIDVGATPLRFGTTPFSVAGTFTLSRQLESGQTVTRVRVANATVAWTGLGEFSVTRFDVASDGSADVVLPARTFDLPGGGRLALGAVSFQMGAGGANPRLALGASNLEVPGIAPDCTRNSRGLCNVGSVDRRFDLPALTLSTADFTHTLLDGSFSLSDKVSVSGRLIFAKSGNVFSVRITDASSGAQAKVALAGLFEVNIDDFSLATSGAMSIDVAAPRIGPDLMFVRGARLQITRAAGLTGALTVRLTGGELVLPVGAPVDLPTVSFRIDLTIDQDFTVGLNLGPAFQISSGTYNLRFTAAGTFSLTLKSGEPTMTSALAGSSNMKLEKLVIDTAATKKVDIRISGQLAFFGHRLAQADMNVTLTSAGVLKATIDDVQLDLGFARVRVDGSFSSDGTFAVGGSVSARVGSCPAGCLSGSVAIDVDSSEGVEGRFSGEVCAAGFCLRASGSMSSTGRVSACVNFGGVIGRVCESLQFGASSASDTIAPSFAQPPSLTVSQDVTGGSDRVVYPQPTATDKRSSSDTARAVPVVCSPASGATFDLGATTVRCTARDAAGNAVTRTFTLTLVDSTPATGAVVSVVRAGGVDVRSVSAAAPRALGTITVRSREVQIRTFKTDRRGDAEVSYRLPAFLKPGRHTVTLAVPSKGGGMFVRNWDVKVKAAPKSERLGLRAKKGVVRGTLSADSLRCASGRKVTLTLVTKDQILASQTVKVGKATKVRGRKGGFVAPFRFKGRYQPATYRAVTVAKNGCFDAASPQIRVR